MSKFLGLAALVCCAASCTSSAPSRSADGDRIALEALKLSAASNILAEMARTDLAIKESELRIVEDMHRKHVATDRELERARLSVRLGELDVEAAELQHKLLELEVKWREAALSMNAGK